MTSFYLEKVGRFFFIAIYLHPGHACANTPPSPTPRHPTRELRGLQFEKHDGNSSRLA